MYPDCILIPTEPLNQCERERGCLYSFSFYAFYAFLEMFKYQKTKQNSMKINYKLLFLIFISLLIISGCMSAQDKAIKIAEDRIKSELNGWEKEGIKIELRTIGANKQDNIWTIEIDAVVTQRIDLKTDAVTTMKYFLKVDEETKIVQEPIIPYSTNTVTKTG